MNKEEREARRRFAAQTQVKLARADQCRDSVLESLILDGGTEDQPPALWHEMLTAHEGPLRAFRHVRDVLDTTSFIMERTAEMDVPTGHLLALLDYVYIEGYRRGRKHGNYQPPGIPRMDDKGGLHRV